jgi:predicted Zn-dependent peptidase
MRLADFEVSEPAPGFRVLVHPTPKFKTITLVLYVHRPLGEEATKLALLPQVLRRGCRGFPDMRKIVLFLEGLYGASMGADVAKVGERHLLSFRFEVVNDRFAPQRIGALEKALGFLWRIFSQPVVRRGALDGDYVAQEKENLRRVIEGMINERMAYAVERCVQEMCRGERYARYEYGKLEEVEPITPAELARLHARVLVEAPADLFIVGDVDPGRAAREAARSFRFRKRSVRQPPPTEVRAAPADGLREVTEKLDVEQGKLVLGCRTGITWGQEETFPLVLYNGLLGAFPHSKLFANVREKEGLAYATHSSLDYTKGILFVTAGIDPAKHARCVEVIRGQMEDLAAGKISDDEWEKTRATLTDRIRSREDNPSAKVSAFLEMALNGRPMTGPEVIDAIGKVRREDVVRVAGRVRPDTLFFLTRP